MSTGHKQNRKRRRFYVVTQLHILYNISIVLLILINLILIKNIIFVFLIALKTKEKVCPKTPTQQGHLKKTKYVKCFVLLCTYVCKIHILVIVQL